MNLIVPGLMNAPKLDLNQAIRQSGRRWTNRILTSSSIGIIFLTFIPFRFDFTRTLPGNGSHFLLDQSLNFESPLHFFLNVLLFIPLGFGVSTFYRDRKKKWGPTCAWTVAIGAIGSYSIEFLQVYVPGRNSAWDDVLTNTLGSFVGFLLYVALGPLVLRLFSHLESSIQQRLTIPRATIIIALYFVFCLMISAHLQKETRLTNWDSSAWLNVRNDGKGQRPWNGQIQRLEIWNAPSSAEKVQRIDVRDSVNALLHVPLASYEISGLPPYLGSDSRLPALSVAEISSHTSGANSSGAGDHPWLSTNAPVTSLINELLRTNQFTIRVMCLPEANDTDQGEIISLSNPTGVTDFALRQDGPNLVMELRNGLVSRRSKLAWEVQDVFRTKGQHDIVVSYDGSWASIYVDGQRKPNSYHLGPGASLVRRFIRIKTSELDGYFILYAMLVFIPLGCLLGIASRRRDLTKSLRAAWVPACFLLPPFLLEILLVRVSGRSPSFILIGMSVALTVTGYLFINLDGEVPGPSAP